MKKLLNTDRFIEIINSINYDIEHITYWEYGANDPFLTKMKRDLDIMEFKLQWKIFELFKPNGDIDFCLDKNIKDKEMLPIYKSIMHSDIPTWKDVQDELLDEIPNLNAIRNYVQYYQAYFKNTLSNVLDVDDFRNNQNHGIIKRIEKISPDKGTELYLTNRIGSILSCLNDFVKRFAALMDKWWDGAPEISNQKIELTITTPQHNDLVAVQKTLQSPDKLSMNLTLPDGMDKILVPGTLGSLTKEKTKELHELSLNALNACTIEEFIYYILHPTLGKLSCNHQGKTFILITALLKAKIINDPHQILLALGKDVNKYAKHPVGNANSKTGGAENLFAEKLEKLLNIGILDN